jgi:hypothetical protein
MGSPRFPDIVRFYPRQPHYFPIPTDPGRNTEAVLETRDASITSMSFTAAPCLTDEERSDP